MTCNLPTPFWDNAQRPGLRAAVEKPQNSSTHLTWGAATPVSPADQVFFNIYYSSNATTLFDAPKAFSEGLEADIPLTLAPAGSFFAVRVSQLGIVSPSADISNMAINSTAFKYPAAVSLIRNYSNGTHITVSSVTDYPTVDGYIMLGDEEIFYSSAIDGYDGYAAFVVGSRDPFGCNTVVTHIAGATVKLFKGFEEINDVFFGREEACILDLPVWADPIHPAIKNADDMGLGTVCKATWFPATTPRGMSPTYYNVYYASQEKDLFTTPKGITLDTFATIPGLQAGDAYYFGVRAMYLSASIDLTDLTQLSSGFYAYPPTASVEEFDGYYASTETSPIVVDRTSGFPDYGFLKIGQEIIAYSSKTTSTFIVSKRDVFDLGHKDDHFNDATVALFRGVEDLNTVSYRAMPTWDIIGLTGPRIFPADGYELANSMQDSDGYRVWKEDIINEDHSLSESENIGIPPEPLCGYRAKDYIALWTRNACGTYAGGRPDGFGGGMNVREVNIQREEYLLAHTGEPVKLLRYKTVGRQCPAFSLRTEHSHERCGLCFGTKILGGYDEYFHPRQTRPDRENPTGLFNARVMGYKNDNPLIAGRGVSQVDEINIWIPSIPFIKKRDIIIRYEFDEDQNITAEAFRHEIISVVRNKIILGFDGKQDATIRKLDKTHPIYQFQTSIA